MKTIRAILVTALVTSLFCLPALAGAKLTINNLDGPSEGFNDPTPATPVGGNTGTTIGQQRLIAFQRAADLWAETLDSDAEIVIDARFDPLTPCDATGGVLGSAGPRWIESDFPGAPVAATWYHGAIVNRLAGEDRDTTRSEINARFNSNLGIGTCLPSSGWYYGLDNDNGTKIDLLVVLLHEFGHGLGFSEFVDSDTGAFIENQVDAYASFLFDNKMNKRWSAMTSAERLASSVNTGAVVLDGPNVIADAARTLAFRASLTIVSPSSIASRYFNGVASFGRQFKSTDSPIAAQLVLAADAGDAAGPSTTDACSALSNGSSIAGKLAMADRGTCSFITKAQNAQNAGAIGLIVVDNATSGPPIAMGGDDPSGSITIPVVSITLQDGTKIKVELPNGVEGRIAPGPGLSGSDDDGRPLVFAPPAFSPGSSTSHYDTSAFPNLLMEPNINDDLTVDVDLTRSYFSDAGWFTSSTMTLKMSDSLAVDVDGDGKADPGDRIRYSLTVTNTAGAGATSVVLTNTPDANTTLVTGSVQTSSGAVSKGNAASDTSVEVALTGLKPGATATAQFDVVVKSGISAAVSSIVNQANLAGSNFATVPSDDPDTTAVGDATSTPLDLTPLKVDKTVVVTADADASGGVTSGDTLTYTISIRNEGTTTINDLVLTDAPDTITTIVAGSVTTSQGTIVSGNAPGAAIVNVSLGALAPGLSASVVLSVKVNAGIPTSTTMILNQATVTSSNVPAVLSNDPRNSVPGDPTVIGMQLLRKRTTRP